MPETTSPVVSKDEAASEAGATATDERFLSELSQVHILLDFISGRTDKSLDELRGVEIAHESGECMAASPQQIVEEICRIAYPPGGGPIKADARQAALMLMVKDRLNRIAAPARGLTVAFTSMFAGVSVPQTRRYANRIPFPGSLRRSRGDRAQMPGRTNANRPSLLSARTAYPYLEAQALQFRRCYMKLPWIGLLVIGFVLWVNWDINVTSSMLDQISKARHEYVQAETTCNSPGPAQKAACGQKAGIKNWLVVSRSALENMVYRENCAWCFMFHPVAIGVRLFGAGNSGKDEITKITPLVSTTAGVIGGLNSIIIPPLFGWLGTMASLLRSITLKVRENTLAPRDYGVARVITCLGMVAGLAVGLFFNGGDASAAIQKGLGATITVSAAGLSFLAGFGAESFFTFLEGLLKRLFPPGEPPGDIACARQA